MTTHTLRISDRWGESILSGSKTIEGRLTKPDSVASKVRSGDLICFRTQSNKEFIMRVLNARYYQTTRDYLKAEGIDKCLPGINSIDEGVAVYRAFYSQDAEARYGITAIAIGPLLNHN